MNDPTEKEQLDIYHGRADHEDNLNLARASLFISVNGFFAIALGFVDDDKLKIIFAGIVLVVNLCWVLWSPNGRIFIRYASGQNS